MPHTTTEPAVNQATDTKPVATVAQIIDAIRADAVQSEITLTQKYLDESTVPFGGE